MKRNELPTEKSLKKLPRWGRVAVIARALRRAMPLIAAILDRGSAKILESIGFALLQAELSVAEGESSEHLLRSCNQLAELTLTVAHDSDDCDEDYTRSAFIKAELRFDSAVPVAVLGELWAKSMPTGWPSDSQFSLARTTFKRPRSNRQALSLLPDDLLQFLEENPNSPLKNSAIALC